MGTLARWLLVAVLPTTVAIVVLLTDTRLPSLPDIWQERAAPYYSAVALAAATFTLAMFVIVVIAPPAKRATLTHDLHVTAFIVGVLAALVWVPLLIALGPRDPLFAATVLLQLSATALLFVSFMRASRPLTILACCLGIAGVLIPISSPVLGVVALAVGSGCAVVLFTQAFPSAGVVS